MQHTDRNDVPATTHMKCVNTWNTKEFEIEIKGNKVEIIDNAITYKQSDGP